MKDGKELLADSRRWVPETVFVRTHNLLTSGDGTPALKWGSTKAYTEDAEGRPRYDWTIVDRIFDTYIERGMKPYVQIGFMPQALSIRPEPYQHHWTPRRQGGDLAPAGPIRRRITRKWGELVYQWVEALASTGTAGPRSSSGTGRSGTSRTSSTGGGRPRNITSSTTTRPTP